MIIIIITLFQLLKMYQFVKNKLVLICEQIQCCSDISVNICICKYNISELHKNDNNR